MRVLGAHVRVRARGCFVPLSQPIKGDKVYTLCDVLIPDIKTYRYTCIVSVRDETNGKTYRYYLLV